MLDLGFSKDGLHNNHEFWFFNHELRLVLIVTRLVFGDSVPEEEFSQFSLLFQIVVRGDLIEPKTHSLGVILLHFGSLQVCFGCFP
jgi:hypothetical protein